MELKLFMCISILMKTSCDKESNYRPSDFATLLPMMYWELSPIAPLWKKNPQMAHREQRSNSQCWHNVPLSQEVRVSFHIAECFQVSKQFSSIKIGKSDCTCGYTFINYGKMTNSKHPVCFISSFFWNMHLSTGFGNLIQDILWCFSQVKGTIDKGSTEGEVTVPFALKIKDN